MEEGIDSGMTYHEPSMARVSKQFDNLLNYSNVEDTGFYNPFKGLQGESEKVVEIQKEAKRVIGTQVMPAFQKLRGIVIKVTDTGTHTLFPKLFLPTVRKNCSD